MIPLGSEGSGRMTLKEGKPCADEHS
ncbi:unnamed protein product [Chondrus crispus]|uniref:Uncharacterized protein n=1 Tax=Chondrus crispus TaxID=2769 RepID=R7QID8_CHOCR|nr:unnamed protein product [Chondrus crispus]CDF37493.1 unnamed protein product [Chondrus crispus]|eukprot:XP_005717364.1 unnamed protein product [Chondrus crispus]